MNRCPGEFSQKGLYTERDIEGALVERRDTAEIGQNLLPTGVGRAESLHLFSQRGPPSAHIACRRELMEHARRCSRLQPP